VPFWSVRTKSSPDLLTQPEMVVWSPEEVPVEVALEPLWSLDVLGDAAGAELWSELVAAPVLPDVDPEPLLPACANVMPAVISRMLVK
jgi:hypothetical protein